MRFIGTSEQYTGTGERYAGEEAGYTGEGEQCRFASGSRTAPLYALSCAYDMDEFTYISQHCNGSLS